MAKTEKYFVGPRLLDDIRQVITRVNGKPDKTSGVHFNTVHQELPRRGGGGIQAVTFTGAWSRMTSKVVTFQGVTSTPNTTSAYNQLFTIGDACGTQVAYIGKVSYVPSGGSPWHLLNVQHHETPVVISATLTTDALEFTRRLVWTPYPGETSTISIQLATDTACSS